MSKRIGLFAGVLFLALIIIIGFISIQRKSKSLSNPLKAIPMDAALVMQINDFHSLDEKLIGKNEVFASLSVLDPINDLIENISYIDSLTLQISDFGEIIYNSKIFVSGHYIGGRKADFLFVIQQVLNENLKQGIDVLSEISGQDLKRTERKYEGKSIYHLNTESAKGELSYYIAEIEGNILISRSVILIENSIRQYSLPKSLLNDDEFVNTVSTAGKSKDANLYIDLRRFSAFLSILANHTYSAKIREYQNFGGWIELDLNLTEKQIMLNGFISEGSEIPEFNGIFQGNNPANITVDKVLPASTSSYLSIAVENMDQLHKNYVAYLHEINKAEPRKKQLDNINATYRIDIEKTLLSLVDEEITLAKGAFEEGEDGKAASLILVKCKSGEQAQKKLREMFGKIQSGRKGTLDQLRHTYTLDSDASYVIMEIPVEDLTGILFGNLFSISGKSFYTILGNYLVIGSSRGALQEFLYNNALSKTLSTNEAFKAFASNIAQKSYFVFYTNLTHSSGIFREYLHEDVVSAWENNFDSFRKIQPFGFQITEVSGMNYANVLIQYLDDLKGKPQTIWESLLDTTFSFKPQLVVNHYTKQNEIFLQDDNNTIYLINKAGRILWKQTLTEKINSAVHQIDFYKNGKFQLLFSTDNYLHLIDRNGNYVERYPVRLRSRASAGMALFDYENSRNYRIFIPCTDKNVYAYTKDGSIISGWEFAGSEHVVNHPPLHFRVEDKDFIVFRDKYRIYILNRRGSVRIPVDKLIACSEKNNFHLENGTNLETSAMVTTDTAGTIIRISFNGDISRVSLGEFSSEHFFDYKDVNADGSKDYIFLDENRLSAYNQDKTEIYNFSFPNDIEQAVIYFNFSYSDRKLGIVDDRDNKIYLLNKDGSLYKGFPLEGSTLFSIGYLEREEGEFNLVVGGRNNFLYNYSVQ